MSNSRGLALRRISGHCTVSADRVYAWYRLAPQAWSFRPDGVREQLIVERPTPTPNWSNGNCTFG